jgi:hypothetical protein
MSTLTLIGNLNLCALAAIQRRPSASYVFGLSDAQMSELRQIFQDNSRLYEFCNEPFAFVTLNMKTLMGGSNSRVQPSLLMPAGDDFIVVHNAIMATAGSFFSTSRTDIGLRLFLSDAESVILRGMLASPKDYIFAPVPWFIASPLLTEKLSVRSGDSFAMRVSVLGRDLRAGEN